MLSFALYVALTFVSLLSVVTSSAITTYTDAACKKSFNNLDAVNGYPDGVCTPLEIIGNLKSFQIARLDPGCAVTLYGPDEGVLTCSSSLKIVAEFATCYNASWAYYSIDGCQAPSSSSIILPTPTSTPIPTPTPAPPSSSVASASPTSPPAGPSPSTEPKTSYTGIIVGGIVAGLAVVAIVFGIVVFCLRRSRHRGMKPLPSPPSYELSIEHSRLEAAGTSARVRHPEKVVRTELWGHDAAAEIGRNSIYVPPAELPGDSIVGEDKKGINPLIKLHTVR